MGLSGICMVIDLPAPAVKATSINRCSLSQEWVQALGRIKLTCCTPEVTVAVTVPPKVALSARSDNLGRRP